MADLASSFTSFVKKCNPDPAKAGNTLFVLNLAAMIFAAASNTFAASIDKNTSKEDKKFLVPAGIVTGFANIGAYFLITTKLIDWIKGSAEKSLAKMSETDLVKNTKEMVDNQIKKAEKGIFKKSDEYISSMKKTLIGEGGAPSEYAKTLYKDNFVAGAGVLGAFGGAIIGCAILTPVIRDISAYFVQKKMEKNNPSLKEKPFRPYFDPAHIGDAHVFKGSKKEPLNLRSYMISTNGRADLKI